MEAATSKTRFGVLTLGTLGQLRRGEVATEWFIYQTCRSRPAADALAARLRGRGLTVMVKTREVR